MIAAPTGCRMQQGLVPAAGGQRDSRGSRAAGLRRPHIVLDLVGHVEVDDVLDIGEVQAFGGDIRCDQHVLQATQGVSAGRVTRWCCCSRFQLARAGSPSCREHASKLGKPPPDAKHSTRAAQPRHERQLRRPSTFWPALNCWMAWSRSSWSLPPCIDTASTATVSSFSWMSSTSA